MFLVKLNKGLFYISLWSMYYLVQLKLNKLKFDLKKRHKIEVYIFLPVKFVLLKNMYGWKLLNTFLTEYGIFFDDLRIFSSLRSHIKCMLPLKAALSNLLKSFLTSLNETFRSVSVCFHQQTPQFLIWFLCIWQNTCAEPLL